MKRFIVGIIYLVSLVSLLHTLFAVPEPTNHQLLVSLFHVMVIIIISIQREEIDNENQ
jgi:cell shape-determining protein MreD